MPGNDLKVIIMKSKIYEKYKKEIVPRMQEAFAIKNVMAVPKILKISLNVGINSRQENNFQEIVESTLTRISGQKPIKNKAKKAISAFKVKENMIVGMKVTLRGQRMYDFLDKLINISLPRIRDFRGVNPKNIDQQGNLSIGLKEHVVFPEIRSDEVERIHGLQINISTNAKDKAAGEQLLRLLGMPLYKKDSK